MTTDLNTTGSFWLDNDGNYWSYGTQMTCDYNGYRLVNKTFYSKTTRKHQAKIPTTTRDIYIYVGHCGYIYHPDKVLEDNLKMEQDRLIELEHARNSKNKQARINSCKQQIALIQKALTRDLMEVA